MLDFQTIQEEFKKVQDHIIKELQNIGVGVYKEDLWNYDQGQGGGRSRLWENDSILEKAGVNFSAIEGGTLPPSALVSMKLPENTPYKATGVSIVLHPQNPFIPTIHLNVRYFECGEKWWFGGGVDLTPYYTKKEDVVDFHQKLFDFCGKHQADYKTLKEKCDEYFFLPHRDETRGVGGLFFDHLNTDRESNFTLCKNLGMLLPNLIIPFIKSYAQKDFTPQQREFQKIRRGRYVEFNLLFDRGTHFGIQSGGRTESILMSLPSEVSWRYDWKATEGSLEAELTDYLKPTNWLNL